MRSEDKHWMAKIHKRPVCYVVIDIRKGHRSCIVRGISSIFLGAGSHDRPQCQQEERLVSSIVKARPLRRTTIYTIIEHLVALPHPSIPTNQHTVQETQD